MWTEYQRHSVRTRKKKSLCGPSTNGIPVGRESRNTMWTDYQRHRQSHNSPGSSGVFTDGIVFSLLHAGFFRRLSVENRFDPLYTRRRIALILFPFSGSRHPLFVFFDC